MVWSEDKLDRWSRYSLGMWLDHLQLMLFWLDGGPVGWMPDDMSMRRFFYAAEDLVKIESTLNLPWQLGAVPKY